MLQHFKFSLPDWVLCTLAGIGLSVNVVQSFLLPQALSQDFLRLALLCAAVVAALVLLSYNKLTAILSVILVCAGLILALFLAYLGVLAGFTESADPEENGRLWYLVVVLCAAIVYLLSRTRLTSWLLLILGALCIAYFTILEYTVYLWGLLLFLFAAGTWICFVGYRRNMLHISALRTAFLPMIGWSAGVSLLCLAVGSLLWWGVIRPLQPPTQDLIVLTEFLQYNRLEQLGLVDENEVYDSSALSDWINENYTRLTDQMAEDPDADTQAEAGGTQQEEHAEDPDTEDAPASTQADGSTDWITYDSFPVVQTVLLGALALLILAALIVLFFRRRAIWYKRRTKDMDDEAYIRFFFPWYLTRLRRMKLPAPMGDSPMEYAARLETSTRFLNDTGVTWAELSEIFSRLVYGGRGVQPGDREKFETFYRGFYRCCRKKLRLAWVYYTLRL